MFRLPRPSSFLKNRRGATAVEAALLLPAVMVFLWGTMEFGRAIWSQNAIQNAMDQAVRLAMVQGKTSSELTTDILAGLPGGSTSWPGLTVTVVNEAADANGVVFATVTASYEFDILVPEILPFGPITLSNQARYPVP